MHSVPGLLVAIVKVGEQLAPYRHSDTVNDKWYFD